MKNIKLTILGAFTLIFALAINLRHAMNGYGIRDNKLHVEVLAQTNSSGSGSTTGVGTGTGTGSGTTNTKLEAPLKTERIHCTISGTLTNAASSSTAIASKWSINGTIYAGVPTANIKLGSAFGKTSDGKNGNYNTGSINVTADFWGTLYICEHQTPKPCNPFDPCLDRLQAYRASI